MEQAKAQYQSIAEMVAALNCDYDRLEELREEKRHWIAGFNVPGYMPESEPALFETFDEARDYVVDEIERAAEENERSEELLQIADEFRTAKEDEYSQQAADGYVYWINRAEKFGLSDEDYWELIELEEAAGDCESDDEARERIEEDALSVEVRSGWQSVGETLEPQEYRIVLCTGGPHVEITGDLDRYNQPRTARMIYKDWGTCEEYREAEEDVLLAYAQVLYFGE